MSVKGYFKEGFNIFDAVIVGFSTVDIIFTYVNIPDNAAISAFRGLRLLRVFKLAKTWEKFRILLSTIWNTLKDVSNFSVLLFLFIFIFMLLGMELFAYKVRFTADKIVDLEAGVAPDSNFDNFLEAFLSVFIVLANDGWSTIYIDHYLATNELLASFFFIALLLIGQYILLNLFLAILLQNFDETSIN